jgi:hypothetical protein
MYAVEFSLRMCKALVYGVECSPEGLMVAAQHDKLYVKGITDDVYGVDKTRFDCECPLGINEG